MALGLGLGLGGPPGPAALPEEDGVGGFGAVDPPPAGFVAVCDGVGEAEWLGDGDFDGPLVRDMPVPSEAFADWPVPPADAETAGRIVVAAPLANVGPLPLSSVYPVTPSATAITPPMSSERRRLRRALLAGSPGAPAPR